MDFSKNSVQETFLWNSTEAHRVSKLNIYDKAFLDPAIPIIWHKSVDEIISSTHSTRENQVGPLGCYIINNADLLGNMNLIIDGKIFGGRDLMPGYWRDQAQQNIAGDMRVDPSVKTEFHIPGITTIVASTGYEAYGHWWLDILPRIWLYKHMPLSQNAKYLFPANIPDFAWEMLRIFEIDRRNCILFEPWAQVCKMECVHIPSLLHIDYSFHPVYKDFVQSIIDNLEISEHPKASKKIFVSRGRYLSQSAGERRFLDNEEEIIMHLIRKGFTIVYPELLSVSEKITAFLSADVIVGEFGSSIHHAIFSKQNTAVVSFGIMNNLQGSIGATFRHRNLYIKPSQIQKDGYRVLHVPLSDIDMALNDLGVI